MNNSVYAKANSADLAEMSYMYKSDFLHGTQTTPWLSSAIASGTVNVYPVGNIKHPGSLVYSSSTSANSGFRLYANNYGIVIGGREKTTAVIKTDSTLTGVTRRTGYHNTVDQTAPTDGVYFKISDGVLTGQTVKASAISTTQTNYTLSASTWYRLVIKLNADATLVTFTLYADDSDTILWSDTLSTNIPLTRPLGHGDICTYSGTSAITIGTLDYLDVFLPNARRVV